MFLDGENCSYQLLALPSKGVDARKVILYVQYFMFMACEFRGDT